MTSSQGDATRHKPVLLKAVLDALSPRDGHLYLDGTFGAGGYSRALLEAADCHVIAVDRDPTTQPAAKSLTDQFPGRFRFVLDRFSRLSEIATSAAPKGLDGIVLDVGVSSMQLDQAVRGFSFAKDGPLDMRMGRDGFTAADLVNQASEGLLADILYRFGEERASRRIARTIVERRADRPFETTGDLADVVSSCLPRPKRHSKAGRHAIHPATRSFQALRIAVNNELDELVAALDASQSVLKPGGVLAVVSFHSLEDRIVKRFLASRSGRASGGSRHEPQMDKSDPVFTLPAPRGVVASDAETAQNPRARSARLRYGVRTDAAPVPLTAGEAALGVSRATILGEISVSLAGDVARPGGQS
jgi:16S rRNA (cytosine1402-N4)-methyltransferase